MTAAAVDPIAQARADAKEAAERKPPTPREAIATYTALTARLDRARVKLRELEDAHLAAARQVYVTAGAGVKIMGESVVYVAGDPARPAIRVDPAKVIA